MDLNERIKRLRAIKAAATDAPSSMERDTILTHITPLINEAERESSDAIGQAYAQHANDPAYW